MNRTTKHNVKTAGSVWPRSVAVIGAAGLIGSGVVERLALEGLAETVYLTDLRENILQAHALDITEAQILAGTSRTRLVVGAPADEGSVDLVIVAASVPETPDGDRRDFLLANIRLLKILLPQIERFAGDRGAVMLLSNPVDVLADALHRMSNISADRIAGYSLNDSIRFRAAIGRELGVAPERVSGLVLGEHGNGQVPLFSRLALDGEPLDLDEGQRARVTEDIVGWFARWSGLKPGRSSGWTTPLGVAQVVKAMSAGEIHPATVWTEGIAGLPSSFVSLPTRFLSGRFAPEIGRLADDEQEGLFQAATSVQVAATRAVEDLETA